MEDNRQMTVAQLRKQLQGLPKDAVIVLALEVGKEDDEFTIERPAVHVTLRPDLKVQIGDESN